MDGLMEEWMGEHFMNCLKDASRNTLAFYFL